MQQATPTVSLVQAISFLNDGTEILSDDDFRALGPASTRIDHRVLQTFVLSARQGKLSLHGTLHFLWLNYNVPDQKYVKRNGRVETVEPPRCRAQKLVENYAVPSEHVSRDMIDFEFGQVTMPAVFLCPSGVPALSKPPGFDTGSYVFDAVRVHEAQLRAVRLDYLATQMMTAPETPSKPGPTERFDRGKLLAEVVAIVHCEGIPPTLTELAEKVRARPGSPKLSFLKDHLKYIYRHPALKGENRT